MQKLQGGEIEKEKEKWKMLTDKTQFPEDSRLCYYLKDPICKEERIEKCESLEHYKCKLFKLYRTKELKQYES